MNESSLSLCSSAGSSSRTPMRKSAKAKAHIVIRHLYKCVAAAACVQVNVDAAAARTGREWKMDFKIEYLLSYYKLNFVGGRVFFHLSPERFSLSPTRRVSSLSCLFLPPPSGALFRQICQPRMRGVRGRKIFFQTNMLPPLPGRSRRSRI